MTYRVRSMGAIQTVYGTTNTVYCNGTTANTQIDSGLKSGFTKVTTDVVTPNFYELQAKGFMFNNPFTSVLTERKDSSLPSWSWSKTTACSGLDIKTNSGGNVRYGPVNPDVVSYPSVDLENLRLAAGTAAMAGVAEPEFNAPVFLAELNEVFRMIHSPFRTMERKFKEIMRSRHYRTWIANRKKRKISQIPDSLIMNEKGEMFRAPGFRRGGTMPRKPVPETTPIMTYMGENWLMYRYGITPVLRDISAALDLLRQEPTHYPRYTSRATKTSAPSAHTSTSAYPSDTYFAGTVSHRGERVVVCRAGVIYRQAIDMSSRTNWNLAAIPEAAWEGLPFSFVADWIVNVGDLIRALTASSRVHLLGAWTVTRDERKQKISVNATPKTVAGYSISGSVTYAVEKEVVVVDRIPLPSVGFAFEPAILDLSNVVWRNRCLDVAGFLSSFLRKKR